MILDISTLATAICLGFPGASQKVIYLLLRLVSVHLINGQKITAYLGNQ